MVRLGSESIQPIEVPILHFGENRYSERGLDDPDRLFYLELGVREAILFSLYVLHFNPGSVLSPIAMCVLRRVSEAAGAPLLESLEANWASQVPHLFLANGYPAGPSLAG